jgi:ParB-like chromosome segregation protein Spo0J
VRPDPSREPLQQRLYRELADALTARLEGQELSWTTVHAAEGRIGARVRLTIAGRLEVPDTHPSMAHARMILAEDAPEQAARDEALVCRWGSNAMDPPPLQSGFTEPE